MTKLSDNPQKFEGLAGVTLGAIIQGISTVITGSVLGLIFVWRIGLVGMGELAKFTINSRSADNSNDQHVCLSSFLLAISVS